MTLSLSALAPKTITPVLFLLVAKINAHPVINMFNTFDVLVNQLGNIHQLIRLCRRECCLGSYGKEVTSGSMYRLYWLSKRRPRIDSWGIPHFSSVHLDVQLPTVTK